MTNRKYAGIRRESYTNFLWFFIEIEPCLKMIKLDMINMDHLMKSHDFICDSSYSRMATNSLESVFFGVWRSAQWAQSVHFATLDTILLLFVWRLAHFHGSKYIIKNTLVTICDDQVIRLYFKPSKLIIGSIDIRPCILPINILTPLPIKVHSQQLASHRMIMRKSLEITKLRTTLIIPSSPTPPIN